MSNLKKIYNLIYPIFAPGFCEGVIDVIEENNIIVIFVDNQLSQSKISAIIDSDFSAEKQYIRVEIDNFKN